MSIQEEFEDFRVSDPSKRVRIFRNENDKESLDQQITIPELFYKTVEAHGDRNALMVKDQHSKQWHGVTYKEYLRRVEKTAKAFIKLGLQRHGAVAILASNCVEWFISDLAAVFAG
jgi:long-chain-fatty-acid--CoA ligase ACSBG